MRTSKGNNIRSNDSHTPTKLNIYSSASQISIKQSSPIFNKNAPNIPRLSSSPDVGILRSPFSTSIDDYSLHTTRNSHAQLREFVFTLRGTSNSRQICLSLSHCSALFKELLQHVHKERLEFFLLSNAKFRFFTKELRFYESKDLYQHTKPDGLCSLRACLLAVKLHVSTTLSLSSNINIEDSDQRQQLIQLCVNIQIDNAKLSH
jgi:hypothetical protein